jgi:hypothetical protein
MFDYVDRLFAIVHPMKLLYMEIDGVSPEGIDESTTLSTFLGGKRCS